MNYLKLYGREEEFDITRRTSESFSKAVYDYVHENFDKSLFGMKGDYNYMLFTGGRFYIDGDSPEICTPPCMEKKGFVEDIVNATIAQRIVLLEGFRNLLKKSSSSVTLEGYSSHENVSYKCIYGRDQKLDKLIPYGRDLSDDTSFRTIMYSSIFRTIGPMLLLFFKNYYSQHGICYEDRSSNGSSRMQFNCEYTPDMDQLRAGIALLYASFRSIEKRVLENYDSSNPIETELSFYNLFPIIFKSKIARHDDSDKNSVYRVGNKTVERPFSYIYADRMEVISFYDNYGQVNIKENGSKTKLTIKEKGKEKTISLTDALKEYIAFFDKEIKHVADDKTLAILNEFAEGKREFLIDKEEIPKFYTLTANDIDPYIKTLIGNESSYDYLKRFRPQPEFELLAKASENHWRSSYDSKESSLYFDTRSMDWEQLKILVTLVKNKNNERSHKEIKLERDYFYCMHDLLEKNIKNKTKYEIFKFLDLMIHFINERNYHCEYNNRLTNYKFLKYLASKNKNLNNARNKKITNNDLDDFNTLLRRREIKLPNTKVLSEIEKKILR